MPKCVVCGKDCVDVYCDVGEGVILEAGERCPDGHYYSQYAYGNTRIEIGDQEWGYSYNEEEMERRFRKEEMAEQIAKVRAGLQNTSPQLGEGQHGKES